MPDHRKFITEYVLVWDTCYDCGGGRMVLTWSGKYEPCTGCNARGEVRRKKLQTFRNPNYVPEGSSDFVQPAPPVVTRTPEELARIKTAREAADKEERVRNGARYIAVILSGALLLALVTESVSLLTAVALAAGVFLGVYYVLSRRLAPFANGVALLMSFLFGAATLTLKTSIFLGGAALVIYILYLGFAA